MENSRKRRAEDSPKDSKKNERETISPSWYDEDDEVTDGKGVYGRQVVYQPKAGANYADRLNDKFEMVYGKKPEWAEKANSEASATNSDSNRENEKSKVIDLSNEDSDGQEANRENEESKVIDLSNEDSDGQEANRENEEANRENEESKVIDLSNEDSDGHEAVDEEQEDFNDDNFYEIDGFTFETQLRDVQEGHFVTPLNQSARNEGAIIRTISFNPTTNIAVVGGDTKINLYRVDPANSNPWLSDIVLEKCEVSTAKWSYGGKELYLSSSKNNRSFLYYNLTTGDVHSSRPDRLTETDYIRNVVSDPSQRYIVALGTQGRVHVFSEKTKEHVDTFHVGSCVKDASFDSTGDKLYLQGGDSNGIYVYDMVRRTIVESFNEFQKYAAQGLAISQNYMACGSVSGIVSVYETPKNKENPKLLKEFTNLVTPTTILAINRTEEILAVMSNLTDNAFKLINLKRMTVFQNTPKGLGRVNSFDYSPNSGYLAIGNNRGKAFLLRMTGFDKY